MPKPHFMPIEVNDWLSSRRVKRMGFAARGAALQLMIEMWTEDACCLPDDDEDLADRLGISVSRWQQLRALLIDPKTGFFTVEDGVLFSEKLSVLFETAAKTSAKRSAAGSRGGKKSAALRSEKKAGLDPALSEAQAYHSQSQSHISEPPHVPPLRTGASAEPDKPKSERAASRRRIPEDWKPSETAISTCRKNYPGVSQEQMRASVLEFRSYWLADGGTKANWDQAWHNSLARRDPRSHPMPKNGSDTGLSCPDPEDLLRRQRAAEERSRLEVQRIARDKR